jgi:hypothetical protein
LRDLDNDLAAIERSERYRIEEGILIQEQTEQNAAPAISIKNSNVILGDVHQPENLQVGNNARINKYEKTGEKEKGILRRIPYWIYILVCFLAALLTCLYYLGWLEPFKEFIVKMIWPK